MTAAIICLGTKLPGRQSPAALLEVKVVSGLHPVCLLCILCVTSRAAWKAVLRLEVHSLPPSLTSLVFNSADIFAWGTKSKTLSILPLPSPQNHSLSK